MRREDDSKKYSNHLERKKRFEEGILRIVLNAYKKQLYLRKEMKIMKKMKRILALLLAVVMMASLSVTAFADETGSITINGVSENNTYEIYRLLDLESYDIVASAYSYKPSEKWNNFFRLDDAKTYFSIDDAGYVTWTWKAPEGTTITED